ncbi:MAG: hypothetical protein ABUT39_14960 [Acidobacteriota bacterium]
MSSKLSIAEVLVDLEAQIDELEKQDAFHAEREEFHHRQRADCAGKLAKIRTKYEAFQAAASEVAEVVRKKAPAPPPAPILPEDPGVRATVSKLVARVVAGKREDERFTASELAMEINRRFPKSLRQPAAPRPVAMALRRLVDQGVAREEQKGKPFHEAVYAKNVRRVKKG